MKEKKERASTEASIRKIFVGIMDGSTVTGLIGYLEPGHEHLTKMAVEVTKCGLGGILVNMRAVGSETSYNKLFYREDCGWVMGHPDYFNSWGKRWNFPETKQGKYTNEAIVQVLKPVVVTKKALENLLLGKSWAEVVLETYALGETS